MGDSWEVLNTIADIDRDEWNGLIRASGGSVFGTHEWLSSYEKAPPAPMFGAHHLVLRRAGKLCAVVPMYDVAEDPHYTGYGPDYDFEHPILHSRMLVGHSWYSYFNGIYTVEPPARIVDGLVSEMRNVATGLNVPLFGFPGVPEQDPLCLELERRDFTPIYTEATSGVDFSGSVSDHISSLRSKNVRHNFRRLSNRAVRLGATVRQDLREGDVEAFATLVEDVCAKHGVPSVNPPDNLHSIIEEMRQFVHFISIWSDEVLLGGFVLLHFEDVLYAWIAGLNYEYHKEFGTYHALYMETLRIAEKLAVKRIEIGRSLYDFKTGIGFHPQLLVSWFQPSTPDGAEILRGGAVAIENACRTRDRIAAAYRLNRLDVPAAVTGPPVFVGVPSVG